MAGALILTIFPLECPGDTSLSEITPQGRKHIQGYALGLLTALLNKGKYTLGIKKENICLSHNPLLRLPFCFGDGDHMQ